ncbi:recombination regulator RecX [Clostridium sp. 19966]|uniref:recombination regulator RecX n=1 Tax=Clostridium sp. 19966 TaxID=2768166 RepID=UPI0028DEDC90|nr:recombination regulator RecX [Clostridium sp. 19966]MDT8716553.1 recombination regulator RecX [Clostridium sp. 19966]
MQGKITKIELQKNNKNRVNIFIDDEYSFSASTELVYTYKLEKNKVIDIKETESIVKEDNFLKAKTSALRIIEKTTKTQKEMKDKLIQKGYEEDIINRVMEFLKEYSFVDDGKYAQMYIKDKIGTKGKNKIRFELTRKGISEDVLNPLLNDSTKEKEYDGAKAAALKKYNLIAKNESDKSKIYQKLVRFLMSKGYDYDIVKDIVKSILREE